MDSFILIQLIMLPCALMANLLTFENMQVIAKGCPILKVKDTCVANFTSKSTADINIGKFNEIGSIIVSWDESSTDDKAYLKCQEDGNYNATVYCLSVDNQGQCSISSPTRKLMMNQNQQFFPAGRVLYFTCETGFTLEGPANIYCKGNKAWSDRIPKCTGCQYPGDINNGYYNDRTGKQYNNGVMAVHDIITAQCHKNFTLSVYHTRTCQENGNWSGVVPECIRTFCDPPSVLPQHGKKYIFPDGTDPSSRIIQTGDKLILQCIPGFSPLVMDNMTCGEKGDWSNGSGNRCEIVNCTINKIEHASWNMLKRGNSILPLTGPKVTYGTTIHISCHEGFTNNGNDNLFCSETGSWSGEEPICTPVTCAITQKFGNGWYQVKQNKVATPIISIRYKEQISVHCNRGFILKSSQQRTCIALNKFNEPEPICEKVYCAIPMSSSNGNYRDERGKLLTLEKTEYNTTIYFHCQIGYKLTGGTDTRICNTTGNWSGINPKCSPITCPYLEEISCGYYTVNSKDFQSNPALLLSYNTTLLFVCNDSNYSCKNNTYMLKCSEDGNWHGNKPLCEIKQAHSDHTETTATNSDAIIGAVCGVISVLIIGSVVFVTIICIKRRNVLRQNKPDDDRQSFGSSLTHATDLEIYTDSQERNFGTGTPRNINEVYINTTVGDSNNQTYYDFRNTESLPKTAIKVDDLQDIVFNGNNVNKTFETQFKALPQGMVENFSEAVKLENKGKNRYTRLYAYDDTRVVLNTEEDSSSDYINACYVHGFNKSRKYIATQGPTKYTVADFWWMVWQEDTSKIVMLTNLIEEGKNKCIKYWPDDMEESFGSLKICLKKVETHSRFDIRTLSVKKGNSAEKMVTQFHFTVWPDKGIPRYASALVHFLKKVNNAPTHGSGPIIVHCSAGVGRTGTYIALDYLTDQGKTLGYVDVAGCVDSLRKQRVSLVQTLDQYIFVHRALVESLMMSSSTVPAQKFQERYCELQQIDPNKNKTRLCIDFENLQRLSPPSEDILYVSAKLVVNRQKNRDSNILPVEDFMPFLTTDDGRPIYINAVFLPSYNEKNAFIITQSPLKSTREEFWMLAWEQKVQTIVMLNSTDEIENDEKYWPEGKPTVFGNIHVSKVSTDTASDHIILTLSMKKNDTTRRIKQIRCGGWRKGNLLPDSPDTILSLLETVRAWQQQTGNHKILVHCMNGADRSGLFCVISSVIERMKIEQDVAIASVIEEMRNAREQIIPCLEQYQFCHEVVLNFIQQYDTYSNFRS